MGFTRCRSDEGVCLVHGQLDPAAMPTPSVPPFSRLG